jgi:hypothetical protein
MLPKSSFHLALASLAMGVLIGTTVTSVTAADSSKVTGELLVIPSSVKLVHRRWPQSIVVTAKTPLGQTVDLTSQATFKSSNEKIAKVSLLGWVQPIADGKTTISISVAGKKSSVNIEVKLAKKPRPYSFRHDVMPALSKGGCNAGSCHGYSLGKNGFKLTLRGSDPVPDYKSLTDEFFSRRTNRHNPPASLLITKPLGDVPHEGGIRFERGSLLHQQMLGWIQEGCRNNLDNPLRLVSIRIHPEKSVISAGSQHQLQLIAKYSDGSERDVTRLGIFNANTIRVAAVDDVGLVTAKSLGETAVVARFERIFATANFIVRKPNPNFKPTPIPNKNLIDRFVTEKLNELNIKPSKLADDATFLRRVYLDLLGIQPKPNEIRAFLADKNPNKREKIVDALFQRPEFVDWMSLKWGDLLQNTRSRLSEPAVYAFREWIRSAIASNLPLDQFVQSLLVSRGRYDDHPASAYFLVSKDADDTLQRATQVFCGVRMLCAKCHSHPFENWTQADYFGLHSIFNQVGSKNDPRMKGVRNAKTVVLNLAAGFSRNPRSGQLQPPRFLGGEEPKLPTGVDRRKAYAKWLTSPTNPYFARSMTNRLWSYFFHRGIIEPVDDLRTTNPPINPELLTALTKDFVEHKFDLRHLMRRIITSHAYQRSSIPNATNAHDDMNFSRAIPRRLPAEALLDSLVQATGVPERFGRAPAGFTAAQLPDAEVQSEFLNLFGKPKRMEACECERDSGSNMLQALHFINGKSILGRVAAGNGRIALLTRQKLTDEKFIEELYMWTVCRTPSKKEAIVCLQFLKSYGKKRTEAKQDLMWALLNSRDFMLVH